MPDTTPPIAAWQVWANPIIRRYIRARLRPTMLGTWLLVTVLVAGFLFFIFRVTSMARGNMLVIDAERMPFSSLLVVQAVILFFLGTGQVAGGITAEADEGVLDYQRLTPMTPLAKVVGFWLGLPIREWLMFAATLPFSFWCIWRGQIPFGAWASIYTVLITSALVYHLTGLTVGIVVKNRRWAFLSSMAIILLLYTVMPQISRFGLIFFNYLSIWPVVEEWMPQFLPRQVGRLAAVANQLWPSVKFFGLDLPQLAFTLFCQGGVALTLMTMVWRRWRRNESHLLSKSWALGLMLWIQLLLIGNSLPLIESGKIFPSREFVNQFNLDRDWRPDIREGISIMGVYAFFSLAVVLMLTQIITPSEDRQLRGLRRARKLAQPRLPLNDDAASAFPAMFLMTFAGSLGTWWFGQRLLSSDWFLGHEWPAFAFPVILLSMMNATVSFHALKEALGPRSVFLSAIVFAALPIMVGAVVGSASDSLLPLTTWLTLLSPIAAPAVAPALICADSVPLPAEIERALPRAFWFWQFIMLCVNIWLLSLLRKTWRKRSAAVLAEPY
jgi:hypothetical protein